MVDVQYIWYGMLNPACVFGETDNCRITVWFCSYTSLVHDLSYEHMKLLHIVCNDGFMVGIKCIACIRGLNCNVEVYNPYEYDWQLYEMP